MDRVAGGLGQATDDHVRDLLVTGGMATEDDLKGVDRDIKAIINEAAQFAQDSPEPDVAELWTDVYAA